MTRAIIVVNFNHALCDNSRMSMDAAARRWGAEFVQLDESFFNGRSKPAVSPASLKCFAFDLCEADEIFSLDADIVVSRYCPDPFETFRGPELIAVANGSGRFGDLPQVRGCEVFEWEKLRSEEPRLKGAVWKPGEYFNTGVMLLKRIHHKAMFDLCSDIVQVDHGLGWNDQTPIVMSAQVCGVTVRLVDEIWNYIHPCMLGSDWIRMREQGPFIYHGAGEPDRINWLPRVIW